MIANILSSVTQNFVYFLAIFVCISGVFILITTRNYIQRIIGLSVFQNGILLFYIGLGKLHDGVLPIHVCDDPKICDVNYSSPLPHVLMLTAIVVGFATLAVALAFVRRIYNKYQSIDIDHIERIS